MRCLRQGPLFQTCAQNTAHAASPADLSCSTQPFTGRSTVALRLEPLGFSNMKPVGLTVNSASFDVLYR